MLPRYSSPRRPNLESGEAPVVGPLRGEEECVILPFSVGVEGWSEAAHRSSLHSARMKVRFRQGMRNAPTYSNAAKNL